MAGAADQASAGAETNTPDLSGIRIGVVGAGLMGRGVSFRFAKFGATVTLIDRDEAALQEAHKALRNIARHDVLFNQARESLQAPDRIHLTTELESLAECAFVVENITENIEAKLALYRRMKPILNEECVLAVNTSAISITRLAALLADPARVLGIHFMNPVHMKHTAEMIRGFHTTEASLAYAQSILARAGMEAVVVNDLPGFVSNRVLMLTVNEAIFTVQDGVATPEDVDRIFRECFGHPMGPLATGDLIGLDTILYTLDVLLEAYNDPKFRPAPLLRKMVDAGRLGRKSGEGFFKY